MPSKLPEDPSNLNILLTTTKKEMIYNIPVNTRWYPLIPVDTRNTRKYPKIPEIPENTRKYPRVKEIPGNTRSHISTLLPDPNPTRYPVFCPIPDPTRYWKILPAGHCLIARVTLGSVFHCIRGELNRTKSTTEIIISVKPIQWHSWYFTQPDPQSLSHAIGVDDHGMIKVESCTWKENRTI